MVDKGTKLSEVNWFPYEGKYEAFAELIRSFWGRKRSWRSFLRAYRRITAKK